MSHGHYRYVLVGGGVAAASAATQIRRRDENGSMAIISLEVVRPYHRPPLSRAFLTGQVQRNQIFAVKDDWFAKQKIRLISGQQAVRLDGQRMQLTLSDGSEVFGDRILLATGATAKTLQCPGAELPGVYALRRLDDAVRLQNALQAAMREGRPHDRGRGRVCIIGGGVLGVEVAGSLREMGLHVELITDGPHLWNRFAGTTVGALLKHHLSEHGVNVHTGVSVDSIEGNGRARQIVLSDADKSTTKVDCDLVITAIGVQPNLQLLKGTAIDAERAILTDDHAQTSVPGIYAAGDCAAVFDRRFNKHRHFEHETTAAVTGALAGRNMAGGDDSFNEVDHYTTAVLGLNARVYGEPRFVHERLVRRVREEALVEIGLDAEGKTASIVCVNDGCSDSILAEMVRQRVDLSAVKPQVEDPAIELSSLFA